MFTNYADPLPPNGQKCPDTSYLYPKQTRYLSSLVTQLDQTISPTIGALDDPNVAVADISQAYSPQGVSHLWCTDAPWAYGLSISTSTTRSASRARRRSTRRPTARTASPPT